MKYPNNQRGTIIPFLAVALVIMILFAAVALAASVSFMCRKAVYDAADMALLSSLMTVEQRSKPTRFTEGTRDEGYYHYRYTQPSEYKNYIYMDAEKARGMFERTLYLNFYKNTKNSKIMGWDFAVRYDNERYENIYKNLPNLNRANYSITCTDSWRDEKGNEYSYTWTEYYIFDEVKNPDSWWMPELGGHLKGPAGWTEAPFEERKWRTSGTHGEDGPVPFPRWVEITAEVTAEVPSPLGSIFGKGERQIVRVKTKAVREITSLE